MKRAGKGVRGRGVERRKWRERERGVDRREIERERVKEMLIERNGERADETGKWRDR